MQPCLSDGGGPYAVELDGVVLPLRFPSATFAILWAYERGYWDAKWVMSKSGRRGSKARGSQP